MKKLLWTTAALSLLLAACGQDDSSDTDTPVTDEPTEEVETEDTTADESDDTEEAEYDPTDQMVESIADMEPVPFEDTKWGFFDTSEIGEKVVSAFFAEDERMYMGADRDSVIALGKDSTIFWEHKNALNGFHTEVTMDELHIYDPDAAISAYDKNNLAVLSKETGELAYQIDLSPYGEMSETLVDNEGLYLALGINTNEEEDYLAETFTLHKFDKVTGEPVWEVDINASKLGHGRANYYVLQQNEELLFILEENDEEISQIVAHSKEDGSTVWTTEIGSADDRLVGARLGRIYHSNGAIYTIDGYNMIHVFDDMTGDLITEYPFNGYMPGGMVPIPVVHDDLFIWQHGTEDYHHLKVVNPKSGEDLWVMDLDGHFLVEFDVIGDVLYAVLGSTDLEAEENTLVARIDPYTGEVFELIDLGVSISDSVNSEYVHKGLTKYNDSLAYFYENLVYLFNE